MSNEVSIVIRARDASERAFGRAEARAARLQERLTAVREKGMAPLASAALSLGPAILPVLAVATTGAMALGAAFAGAGAALGVFGAVASTTMAEIKEQDKLFQSLNEKVEDYGRKAEIAAKAGDTKGKAAALKQQAAAQEELNARMKELSPEQRKAVQGYSMLRESWKSFVEANKPQTFAIFGRGFNIIKKAVPLLQPLFDAGAKAVSQFLGQAGKWQAGGGLKSMIDFLAKQAGTALPILGRTFANIGSGLGKLFKVAGQGSGSALGVLEKLSKTFSNWAAGDSFQRFMDYAADNAPLVGQLFGSLAQNVALLVQIFTPFAPLSLAIAAALSAILNAIPVSVLQKLVALWLAYSLAMRAYGIALMVAAGYTKTLMLASKALSFVLSANPIGLIIGALALLVIGIIAAYKHFDKFRWAVNDAMSLAGRAVLTTIEMMIQAFRIWLTASLFAVGKILDAVAKIPGPTQDAAKKAAAAFKGFQGDVDRTFNKVNSKIDGYKRQLASMPAAKLKAEIKDLTSKVDAAKRKLRTVPASRRSKLLADISQLQRQAQRAIAQLHKIKDRYVSVFISEVNRDSARAGLGTGRRTGGVVGQAATGGVRGGWTNVGEEGPERLKLPPGTYVKPAGASRKWRIDELRSQAATKVAMARMQRRNKALMDQFKRTRQNAAPAPGRGGASGGRDWDLGGRGGGGDFGGTIRVIVEGTGILSGLRREIRYQGGNVQVVLGR